MTKIAKPTRCYSKNQEKTVASKLNGKTVSNSGATRFNKGDVVTEYFLIECKTKTSPSGSFSIKKEWLEKNRDEAFAMGKMRSALAFNYGPGEPNYYIIDDRTFQELNRLLSE